ncbi:MAG: polysaccharide deacetylase family protein, partial [Candidatus Acidiferrum sp.]
MDPGKHLNLWIQLMLPAQLICSHRKVNAEARRLSPPHRIRPWWKLVIYLLIEFSPFIIARNWIRRWRRNFPVVILTHHLISDDYHHLNISTSASFKLIRFLKRHYRIVSLREATELLKSGFVLEPTVVLTFDDGYEDNFLNLRAVAEQLDVPVSHFVSTEIVTKHQEFDHDLKQNIPGFLPLSWEQIRYWSREGAEFSSHTRSHFDCGGTVIEKLDEEIVQSKLDLENRLGLPVWAFAFPFGKPENMSLPAVELASKHYECFVSYYGGVNFP